MTPRPPARALAARGARGRTSAEFAWVERHWAWLLVVVFLLGAATRLLPLARYAIWGSDTGEYVFLTERLVASGGVDFSYDGWGIAYPYFPGMFLLTGAVSAVLGVNVLLATKYVLPLLAGLLGVLAALVARRVTGDERVALLAGFIVAVTSPSVIVTSHAMPGTLGHIFLMLLVLLLVEGYESRAFALLALPVGAALLMTHHLSTYFAVGVVAMVFLAREVGALSTSWRRVRLEAAIVVGLVLGAVVWWMGVAGPFRDRIVGETIGRVSPWVVAGAFLAALALLPALVWARRRLLPAHRLTWRPRVFSARAGLARAVTVFGGVLSLCAAFIFVPVPTTTIQVTWVTIAYVAPILLWLAFTPLGGSALRFHRYGLVLNAWVYAILASLALAVVSNSKVLFPYRHVDYVIEAAALVAAVGMIAAWDFSRAAFTPKTSARIVMPGLIALALVAGAVASQPPRETVGGFEEGITHAEFAAVLWARDNLPPEATLAADHRVSSLMFGIAGLRASWDYTPRVYHAESWGEALEELASVDIPSGEGQRIDHVFLSPEIRQGVTLTQWENSAPMSLRAWEKFFDPGAPLERVYADEAHDVYVFRVVWPSG